LNSETLTKWARRVRSSRLAKNTLFMSAGSSIRLILQAVYFLLIARALGPAQYGAFVGTVALIGIGTSFAGFGFGGILVKHTSRDAGRFSGCWGNALFMTVAGGVCLLLLLSLAARYILGSQIPFQLVLLVALADLFFSPTVALAGQAFMAFEKLHGTAGSLVVLSALRTLGAIVLAVFVHHPSAVSWAMFYLLSSAVAAIYAIASVSLQLGSPKLALRDIKPDLSEGFFFAIGASSQTVYNDIDKTMLVRLSELSAAGIYGSAYRLVDVTFQPVSAVLTSTFAKFFKAGEAGIFGSLSVARRLIPYVAVYGAAAAFVMFIFSPVLPLFLGHSFVDSIDALRWLSALALIRPVHYVAANALTGAGFQGLRALCQIVVAGVNVALNFWLIPAFSWRGAAWASIASDGLLAVALWGLALSLLHHGKNRSNLTAKSTVGETLGI